MRTELQAISLRIQTVRSNEQMMQSMKGATGLLKSMNKTSNLPALQKIMMDFQKESDMMEFREEMMTDAIDDVDMEDEEETDDIVNQVLDEIGVERESGLGNTPLGLGEPDAQKEDRVAQAIGGDDSDLQARFNNLAGAKLLVPDGSRSRSGTTTPVRATRDRPLLSPNGRHLRHLKGLAIRNITSKPSKARRRSNDDENLLTTWRSPGKLAVMPEERTLTHSRSAIDLSSLAAESSAAGAAGSSAQPASDDTISEGGRPNLVRKRRNTRANSILAGTIFENAATRQKILVDATLGRLVDTFFTLHHESVGEEPFYISEIVPSSINPTFQGFDLSECGPAITRLDSIVVRVWSRKEPNTDFGPLIELTLGLSYLQFIGRNLENLNFSFPENCLVFVLSDGCYTIFSELDPKLLKNYAAARIPKRFLADASETCSFDAILKMKNLEDCIYDAKETQARLEIQMDSLATSKAEYLSHVRALDEENLELKDARKTIARERKRLEALRKHHEALRQSIGGRKAAIDAGAENRAIAKKHLLNAKQQLHHSTVEASQTAASIVNQRKVILEDLTKIYPIDHIPEQPLNFTICNLYLPNEAPEGHNEDVIAAALGHVAHLVYILSFYLRVYLRYPVIPKGSSSMVQDPISVIQGSRFFPLWAKGVPYFRFEYAIFLLNKNIEQLMESQKCIVLDIRHTLPNLKYLLYVTTASQTPMSLPLSIHPSCEPVLIKDLNLCCADDSMPAIDERPSKPFNLPISRRAAAALADTSGRGGGEPGVTQLSRSLPKSTIGFPTTISPNGTIGRSTISFKRDFRKTQDVL
ncbi:hypothetical protein H072_3541 [Dactylellina haptotyla CBS 200.50]|uniref:Autophagy-related protein 14 n=1 Tax=Dactylellina haptotyla (strain CBS 200.50) TaxID=1284197 RepID=S8AHG7_DACHA|nr:hypothetical protein H072_3541 [Dactylellina haptotyla CBS 200.50]